MTQLGINDVQTDLNAVNDQLTTLVEELNKMNATREQLVTQIQNLNGVAMYLRGKLPTEGAAVNTSVDEDSIERNDEYPITDA